MFELKSLQLYRDEVALCPAINLSIARGELKVIMGPSGCGKSTLLAAIAGSLHPGFSMAGDIVLSGRRLNGLPIAQRHVAIQYQDDLLFPHMNVAGNLLFALARTEQKQRMDEVESALSSAGLQGFAQRDIATLSGGQRARVSLLRALLAKPKLLLLDEPFSRLDQALRDSFRAFVFSQIERCHIPALLVTHDLQDCPNNEYYALAQGEFQVC